MALDRRQEGAGTSVSEIVVPSDIELSKTTPRHTGGEGLESVQWGNKVWSKGKWTMPTPKAGLLCHRKTECLSRTE